MIKKFTQVERDKIETIISDKLAKNNMNTNVLRFNNKISILMWTGFILLVVVFVILYELVTKNKTSLLIFVVISVILLVVLLNVTYYFQRISRKFNAKKEAVLNEIINSVLLFLDEDKFFGENWTLNFYSRNHDLFSFDSQILREITNISESTGSRVDTEFTSAFQGAMFEKKIAYHSICRKVYNQKNELIRSEEDDILIVNIPDLPEITKLIPESKHFHFKSKAEKTQG